MANGPIAQTDGRARGREPIVGMFGFLDVAGNRDPSLLLVLGLAVGVTALTFGVITKRSKPMYDTAFATVRESSIGFCPGPGIVVLARLSPNAFGLGP